MNCGLPSVPSRALPLMLAACPQATGTNSKTTLIWNVR